MARMIVHLIDSNDKRPNGYGNKYPATCLSCGQHVEVGAGWTDWWIKNGRQSWYTIHFNCPKG